MNTNDSRKIAAEANLLRQVERIAHGGELPSERAMRVSAERVNESAPRQTKNKPSMRRKQDFILFVKYVKERSIKELKRGDLPESTQSMLHTFVQDTEALLGEPSTR